MHCRHILFVVFLVIYFITGVIVGIAAYLLHETSLGHTQHGFLVSIVGRYYIAAISPYILITCIIYFIARLC